VSSAKRFAAGIVVLAVPFAVWAIAKNPPTAGGWYPPCIFNVSTGLYCPGCGGTRALHLLANGNVLEALRQNALLFLLLPFALWYMGSLALFAAAGKWKQPLFSHRAVTIVLAILVIGYGVLRNIPYFGFLAPKAL
jgi:hypothetical protein